MNFKWIGLNRLVGHMNSVIKVVIVLNKRQLNIAVVFYLEMSTNREGAQGIGDVISNYKT